MSHLVTIEAEVRDVAALRAACRRLGLPEPVQETAQLYSGAVSGYCVRLLDWRYPVVCDIDNGQVRYDNFAGRWGQQFELDRLMQAYAIEMTHLAARRLGHTVTEQPLADGAMKLTIQVGEGEEP